MAGREGRNVRPRGPHPVPSVTGNNISNNGELRADCTAVTRPVAVPANVVSPLLVLLQEAVAAGNVVRDFRGQVYTGFANYSDLANSQCKFVPMNSNRAISREVVLQRVKENVEAFERSGQYLEFGQINLLIMSRDPSHDFLVMDGQHRCHVMSELHRSFPTRELTFQFRAKAVPSEQAAFDELRHFQRSYPTDPRSFFRTRAEERIASAVLTQLKETYPGAFKSMVLADNHGRGTADPVRPFLNDNLIYWLLQDSGLLTGAGDRMTHLPVLAKLRDANHVLASLPLQVLGKGATERMRQTATRVGCWLGFFRDGGMQWQQIEEHLRADRVRQAAPLVQGSCALCMDAQSTMAMQPCGHLCLCEDCAVTICNATPRKCPICRGDVEHAQRIYGTGA